MLRQAAMPRYKPVRAGQAARKTFLKTGHPPPHAGKTRLRKVCYGHGIMQEAGKGVRRKI
ncbi:hypothetical protein AD928_03320 [Acetobacter cerevisiae]|uniref:Uncharacterized protein n=1 Tax=Acetobacter cerevisiae TaxID=178900 RepID=A0A149VC88_9PROT|nr:hypothetical protein AD928_03320 [Acetobacter cerevisiae]KXV77764.1 hypothetical protein AD954_05780 [Acetobacter cerevisiae]